MASLINQTSSSSSTLDVNESLEYYLFLVVVDLVLATASTIGNTLLLLTVYCDPCRNLRTPPAVLVTNLGVADLLHGLGSGYTSAIYGLLIYLGKPERNSNFVVLIIANSVLTIIVSTCTILAMSVDRFLAVLSPITYTARISTKKFALVIVGIWVYAVLFNVLGVARLSLALFSLLYCHLHISFPVLILIIIYSKTLRVLREHRQEIEELTLHNRDTTSAASRRADIRERKMVSAFLIVLLLFFVSFLPHYVALNLMYFCGSSCTEAFSYKLFKSISLRFSIISCILDPFVYAWRVPKYRQAFKSMAKFARRRRNVVDTLEGVQESRIIREIELQGRIRKESPCAELKKSVSLRSWTLVGLV